jgi:signal peptidase II
MQLGGAAGNLIDRVRRGEVTDFVDVGSFPTFNVADSAITISIIAVLAFFLLEETGGGDRKKPEHAATAGTPDAGPQPASDD